MSRPSVPPNVKRQLRQESGFGCCECGHPFIEYHHIVPYAVEKHFRPEDMMALCPNHHHLCTTGALSEIEQRRMKANPRNVKEGLARGKLFVTTSQMEVRFGGGIAINTPDLLTVDGIPVVRCARSSDGRVVVSANIHDNSGNPIALLIENEWQFFPDEIWDFETSTRNATIRSAPRDIAFAIDCRNDGISIRGRWQFGGDRIVFDEEKTKFGILTMSGYTVKDSPAMYGFLT